MARNPDAPGRNLSQPPCQHCDTEVQLGLLVLVRSDIWRTVSAQRFNVIGWTQGWMTGVHQRGGTGTHVQVGREKKRLQYGLRQAFNQRCLRTEI